MYLSTPSVKQISDFFMYLYQDLNRRPSTIDGYRTAIVDTLDYQYLSHNEELSALIKQNHYHMEVEGCSRSVIQDCGCDREGRKTKLGS